MARHDLTTVQKARLREYITILRKKHRELNMVLKSKSPEYAELSATEDPTREDRLRLLTLRQHLMANS